MEAMQVNLKDWVSVETAAEIIGCSKPWVRQLAYDGELEYDYFSPRAMAIKKTSAEKYAKKPKILGRPRGSFALASH